MEMDVPSVPLISAHLFANVSSPVLIRKVIIGFSLLSAHVHIISWLEGPLLYAHNPPLSKSSHSHHCHHNYLHSEHEKALTTID